MSYLQYQSKNLHLSLNILTNISIIAIDCVWGSWGEWGECDTLCGDGLRERGRVHEIVAEYNGKECPGEPTDDKVCNVLEETRREVAEQKARIEELENELNPRESLFCRETEVAKKLG